MNVTISAPITVTNTNGSTWTLDPGSYVFTPLSGQQKDWYSVTDASGKVIGNVHLQGNIIS